MIKQNCEMFFFCMGRITLFRKCLHPHGTVADSYLASHFMTATLKCALNSESFSASKAHPKNSLAPPVAVGNSILKYCYIIQHLTTAKWGKVCNLCIGYINRISVKQHQSFKIT